MTRLSTARAKTGVRMAVLATTAMLSLTVSPALAAPRAPQTCDASNYWAYLQGSDFKLYLCGVGTTNLSGPDQYTRVVFSNHSNRIWLHQHPDGTGWADCYEGPNTEFAIQTLHNNPGNVQVSSNLAHC